MLGSSPFGDPFERNSQAASGTRPRIVESVASVFEEIQRICISQGRDSKAVKLVAVSKTRTVEEIKLALKAGVEDLGENYLQEAREKARKLPGVRWHLIGNLQKNKVNLAVDLFEVLHSLDDLELIRRLEARCEKRHRYLVGLLQVKMGSEKSKKGLDPKDVLPFLDELAKEPPTYLRLSGLMTIPPPVDNPEDNRVHFRHLRELLDEILAQNYSFWAGQELSMGMSDDYTVAVEEGATMIRLGRVLFGDRGDR